MNISAIVSEYNPLHKGHVYQIEKTKEITNCDGMIAIMSGNFVQRGLPSVIDKWIRTKMALVNGIDLVIELPSIYSLSSAEFFSYGALSMMNSLGCVNNISFGSECGSIEPIMKIASVLSDEPELFKTMLKENMSKGHTYPVSVSKALIEYFEAEGIDKEELSSAEILSNPNNTLGIEYCKSIIRLKSEIKPYTIKRLGGAYNSEAPDPLYSSASAIRRIVKEASEIEAIKDHVTVSSYNIIKSMIGNGYRFTSENDMMPFIKHKAFSMDNADIALPEVSEGIHYKIYKAIESSSNFDELIKNIKSKRYTYNRISRIMCQFFIGFDRYNYAELRSKSCPYARVLGFNENGRKILHLMKKNSSIPLLTKIPKQRDETLNIDILSTKAYSLINKSIKYNDDFLISPIIL